MSEAKEKKPTCPDCGRWISKDRPCVLCHPEAYKPDIGTSRFMEWEKKDKELKEALVSNIGEPEKELAYPPEHKSAYFTEIGKWKKGHPTLNGQGVKRRDKLQEKAYLAAVEEIMPPYEMAKALDICIEAARKRAQNKKNPDPRWLFEIVKFVMEHGYGKPTQHITVSAEGLLEDLRELIEDPPETEYNFVEGHFSELPEHREEENG